MSESKRDESRLPHVWIAGGTARLIAKYGTGVPSAQVLARPGTGRSKPQWVEYCPASELEAAQRRVAELEKAARYFKKHADALMRNVYNEHHAHESLSVHEVGQLLRKCCDTGSALDALIKP